MLITGIRQRISSEFDTHRSATFMRYLMHFMQMFAFMGVIIPLLIGVDYFIPPQTTDETVINKFYHVTDNINNIEYHIFTDNYHFLSDNIFYENTNSDTQLDIQFTPIFRTVTSISHVAGRNVYTCKPNNIYGWALIIAVLTFVCSIIIVIKMWCWIRKREYVKYDSVVNLGIINAFLCLMLIISTLFHIP